MQRGAALFLAAAHAVVLGGCGSVPPPTDPSAGRGPLAAAPPRPAEPDERARRAERCAQLLARAAFPALAPGTGPDTEAYTSWSSGVVLAWVEGSEVLDEAVVAGLAARSEPAVRRALAWGAVAGPRDLGTEVQRALLDDSEPAVREAAVLLASRLRIPVAAVGDLGPEERELLQGGRADGVWTWNRVSVEWVEGRFVAARRHGRIDGRAGRVFTEAELAGDPRFLAAVARAALEAEDRAQYREHYVATFTPDLPPGQIASALAQVPPAELWPGGGGLDEVWLPALIAALLSPACDAAVARSVQVLGARLPRSSALHDAAGFALGDPRAGLGLGRRFDELPRDEALAVLVFLGRIGASASLSLVSDLAHPSPTVALHVQACRVACGDLAPLDTVFAPLLALDARSRAGALEALLRTGAAARQGAWILQRTPDLDARERAALALELGSREAWVLAPLLDEDADPEWAGVAVARMLAGGGPLPPELAAGWPRGAAEAYDRELAAALLRRASPRLRALFERALPQLETDVAVLVAASLARQIGPERLGEALGAMLLTESAEDARRRLAWILGRVLGSEGVRLLPRGTGGPDALRAVALLGFAARRAEG